MNFENLVLLYSIVIFVISPINMLGEQVSNYKEIEPGGKIRDNEKEN